MKKFKKISAVVLSGLMIFSVAACGKDTVDKAADAAGQVVEEVQENKVAAASIKMNEAENMKGVMNMDMKMSADGETMDIASVSDMVIFNNPMKMKMDMTSKYMDEEMKVQYYIQMNDKGDFDMYYGSDETGWIKSESTIKNVEALKGNTDYYLKYAENFESAGEEEVNGEMAEKFTGVIKAEDMNEVLDSTNIDTIIPVDESSIDIKEIFKDMDGIPMSIWISNESGYPVKYDMDMTQMMQVIMDSIVAQLAGEEGAEEIPEIKIDNISMTMTFSDFNNAEDFEIPAEVLENAVEMDLSEVAAAE